MSGQGSVTLGRRSCFNFATVFAAFSAELVVLLQILTVRSALQQQSWVRQTVCSTSYCEPIKAYTPSQRQTGPTKSLFISSEDSCLERSRPLALLGGGSPRQVSVDRVSYGCAAEVNSSCRSFRLIGRATDDPCNLCELWYYRLEQAK